MHGSTTKILVVVIAAAIVLLASVSAYSFWTSDGGGTGTAATGGTANLTVVQTSTVSAMGPGVAAQGLSGTFTNNTGAPTYVGTVTVVVSGTSVSGCGAGNYTIAGSPMTVDDMVPVGSSQGTWSGASIAFANDPAVNQDICKSATVNLTYAIS